MYLLLCQYIYIYVLKVTLPEEMNIAVMLRILEGLKQKKSTF